MKVSKDKWVWMPHPAHFICANYCRFFLATKVGKYIVSTVGEYVPSDGVREIIAQCRGIKLEGKGDAREADFLKKIGFEEIGCDRKYETMVFHAVRASQKGRGACEVCPFQIASGNDVDFEGYNTAKDAYKGHLKMCTKYANK